mmetsp:Transcript_51579/g.120300  ORF Transcript_51579/g.120300 Transcript_51579/m.120300 type:complete len:212 (+) Transcript_51579:63-698(+)
MSILLRDSSLGFAGYHLLKTHLGIICSVLLALFSTSSAGDVGDLVSQDKPDAAFAEIQANLQDIDTYNKEIRRILLQQGPRSGSASNLELKAWQERQADKKLLKAIRSVEQDVKLATRGLQQLPENATADSSQGPACADGHACSWFDRFAEDCMRHKNLVIAGLTAFLLVPLCGAFLQYRRYRDGDASMRRADDLDEVWFRKPETASPTSP